MELRTVFREACFGEWLSVTENINASASALVWISHDASLSVIPKDKPKKTEVKRNAAGKQITGPFASL